MIQSKILQSPLRLPEGRSGQVSVRHRYMECDFIVSVREAYMTGKVAASARFDPPRLTHELCEGDDVWMSDRVCELAQMKAMIPRSLRLYNKPRPVLVGGLGLGILPLMLAKRDCSVTVCEINQDVINLCDPKRSNIMVKHQDIMDHIMVIENWPYVYAFLDTWRGTNEAEWWESVFPLKRAVRQRHGNVALVAWAEDVMAGQIYCTIKNGNLSEQKKLEKIGFTIQPRSWKYAGLPDEMSDEEIAFFIRDVGLPKWEEKYGCLYV